MTGLEILVLVAVLALVLVAAQLVRAASPFIVNAIVGLVVLYLAQAVFGLAIAITPVVIAIVALGGLPGSIVVIVLSVLEIAFV
ncbi:hypothetical protein C488_17773 [Natrinema pellirubrum DSM 15624]|uniref:SigmaK-factor processing regulatory protein BofA n=2 Tax=Natrinema TaxID=88723 RepID=L0JPI7_NATP1|nr:MULTISPECIES: pro-sigmaK processing inhibitor BofA family protein [Natrinema]ELZ11940.1 hypothetical protein C478_11038 [Natrinema thermotolerans DSM 11552]AGB33430.1 hypothetical protein Natpe_3665 [Natrinema pellirubrum DSM 15624]ELY71258.1 hypothetical protein C488_17773 [Natrinema pellirubrum DSM 15624]QCC58649.1 hypothetical protein DVR14_08410 [Natrinema thermotolerans]WMT09789.1 pro-sigmaK processing inhibitor BofA family protein [Natrinema thermotolerans]